MRTTIYGEPAKQITVLLPMRLIEEIQKLAHGDRRSISQQVTHLLETQLKERQAA